MTTTPHQEAERTAAIAATMRGPHEKRMMRMISESWERMGRYDAAPMPYYPRDGP